MDREGFERIEKVVKSYRNSRVFPQPGLHEDLRYFEIATDGNTSDVLNLLDKEGMMAPSDRRKQREALGDLSVKFLGVHPVYRPGGTSQEALVLEDLNAFRPSVRPPED